MDLRLSLIWATRGSESEGCRRSGQILVNPATICLGVPLQNVEKLISYYGFFESSAGILRQQERFHFIIIPFKFHSITYL